MAKQNFYSDEKFADIQMLRYRLNGFEQLTLQQKKYIYYLSLATLCGRDITADQYGKYNIKIRKLLEAVYRNYKGKRTPAYRAFEVYLKRVWFSNGIYHHYGCDKFVSGFTARFLRREVLALPADELPLDNGQTAAQLCDELFPVIFNADVLPKRVNKADGEDIVLTSACNFYEGVSQAEVEAYYAQQTDVTDACPPSYGLNSKLVKTARGLKEERWTVNSRYGKAIRKIIFYLEKAAEVAENDQQRKVIALLIDYYRTGNLKRFDEYSVEWLKEQEGRVDFINGFIEVYGDPLGLKGTWEGIVTYKDEEATQRTRKICNNAQWFEDHSPVDARFKKKTVKGVTANAVCAAMLGGEEYPSTAIGINLPNADWIRAAHGSKSITIGNLTQAYSIAAEGSGFKEAFVDDAEMRKLMTKYESQCDDLHTDLHECLGHGSGQLLPGVLPDALKAYGNTIEEARADLFGLYYMADAKMVELGLLENAEAYKAQYYSYMLNGLMTQLRRITPGHQLEEAHMRNRALIAHWVLEHAEGAVELVQHEGKTWLHINDYEALRALFAQLLAEVQRIKSEGDLAAAKALVERYAVKVDAHLLNEVHERYASLHIAPYKGFINPVLEPVYGKGSERKVIVDIKVTYTESYEQQMLRYSREYSFL